MKKKILTIVMAATLAATSFPMVSASAATVDKGMTTETYAHYERWEDLGWDRTTRDTEVTDSDGNHLASISKGSRVHIYGAGNGCDGFYLVKGPFNWGYVRQSCFD